VDAAARTGNGEADLPSLPELRSGMFGRAVFDTRAQILTVPSAASWSRTTAAVFVAENTCHTRLVTIAQVKDKVWKYSPA